MGCKKLTFEENLLNLSNCINNILRKYNFDRRYLFDMYSFNRVTKVSMLKGSSNYSNILCYHECIIWRESINICVTLI